MFQKSKLDPLISLLEKKDKSQIFFVFYRIISWQIKFLFYSNYLFYFRLK